MMHRGIRSSRRSGTLASSGPGTRSGAPTALRRGRSSSLVKNIDRASIYTGFHHACIGESSDPGPGVEIRGRLVFAAEDGRNGRELWLTDGTNAGTRLLRDIRPGQAPWEGDECDNRTQKGLSSSPDDFLAFRGDALFTADDGTSGRELWWTDGTAAGTRRVKDLLPGPAGSDPHGLTAFRGKVYSFARRGTAGEALWRTDGTRAGTVLVDDLTVAGTPSWPRDLTVVGERLFFPVYNERTGAELWTSLGDASSPGPFSLVDDALLTGADDGEHGRELWAIPVSD